MKRYTITVNGNAYDVTVDEADGSAPAVAAAPAPKKAAPAKKAAAPAGAQGNASVNAPMNGTIVDVKVKVGRQGNQRYCYRSSRGYEDGERYRFRQRWRCCFHQRNQGRGC